MNKKIILLFMLFVVSTTFAKANTCRSAIESHYKVWLESEEAPSWHLTNNWDKELERECLVQRKGSEDACFAAFKMLTSKLISPQSTYLKVEFKTLRHLCITDQPLVGSNFACQLAPFDVLGLRYSNKLKKEVRICLEENGITESDFQKMDPRDSPFCIRELANQKRLHNIVQEVSASASRCKTGIMKREK